MTDATVLTGERPALYDRDFHAWAEAQAAALRCAAESARSLRPPSGMAAGWLACWSAMG